MAGRILLVEDSAMISGALRILLESAGYDVTVAETAAAAAAWNGPVPADVMLLDLALPDGDGLGVVALLEERGLRPRVVFAMTGHGDAATRERCRAAGCDGVLVKPVPVQELLRIVAEPVT